MANDPMSPIHALCKRVSEEAEKLNLSTAQIVVIPGAPDQLVVTFLISEEAVESQAEADKRKLDADFAAITANLGGIGDEPKLDSKTQEAVESMEETLRKWQEGK